MSDITVEVVTAQALELDVATATTLVIDVDTAPQSTAILGFNHVQSSAATEWIINHNLGFKPNVQAFSTGGVAMVGEIIHMSINQTRIYFNTPLAGSARFS